MSIRIDICNIALNLLATRPLTSIEDDSDTAIAIKTNYYLARDSLLEEADWSFSIRRFIPAMLTDEPSFGPAKAFAIPSDIMRVVTVDYNKDSFGVPWSARALHLNQAEWAVESGYIVSDSEAIYCRGVRRIEDEGIYSALFATTLAARIAMMACYSITKSNTRFNELSAMYAGLVADAQTMDGLQGRNTRIRRDNLQRARTTGGVLY